MDEGRFWQLIEESKAERDPVKSDQPEVLQAKLERLSPDEIRSFKELFLRLWYAAYREDLWGAAYIIEGGCSEDGFMDFRSGLIGLGRDAYYQALGNPETLAEQPTRGVDFSQEGLLYAADGAYEAVTGEEMPDCPEVSTSERPEFRWDEESVYARFPRLAAQFRRH